MTLVLAVKAADGVVLASDSEATSGESLVRTRDSAQKLDDLHGRIAFGCSGDYGLRQRIVAALRKELSATDCEQPIETLRPQIHGVVNALQQKALTEHVPLTDSHHPACLAMLFVGMTHGRKWIYEIAADGKEEEHDDPEAIGSARHYAVHGMLYHQHLDLAQRPLNQVRLAAYRILYTAIAADGTGSLGVPVQIYEVRETGARALLGEELKVMHDALNGLKEQERDLWVPTVGAESLGEDLITGVRVDDR